MIISDGVKSADLHLSQDVEDGQERLSRVPLAMICEACDRNFDERVDGARPRMMLLSEA